MKFEVKSPVTVVVLKYPSDTAPGVGYKARGLAFIRPLTEPLRKDKAVSVQFTFFYPPYLINARVI